MLKSFPICTNFAIEELILLPALVATAEICFNEFVLAENLGLSKGRDILLYNTRLYIRIPREGRANLQEHLPVVGIMDITWTLIQIEA